MRDMAAARFARQDDAQLRAARAVREHVMGTTGQFVGRYQRTLAAADNSRSRARKSLKALAS